MERGDESPRFLCPLAEVVIMSPLKGEHAVIVCKQE